MKWSITCCVVLAVCCSVEPTFAVEVTEPAGAEHGYPALCDSSGRKLANGEFRQWLRGDRLHVIISYDFPDGRFFEENASFRQTSELVQEKWSWKELSHGQVEREFTADLSAGVATAHIRKDNKNVSEKIDIEHGRTFAGFGFTIALSNLRPRLIKGEVIELKAVGFSPIPTLKPQVVTVKVSHAGLDRMKMSGRFLRGDNFLIHPEVPIIAKLLISVPDTHIWLTYPPPAGFLRWQGPIVLPNDPLIGVDLVSDSVGGPAERVK
jgi:hypothetical protein